MCESIHHQKDHSGKKHDPAFCLNVFCNWKNAVDSFKRHQTSKAHNHAVTMNALEKTLVHTQLLSVMAKTQEARHCFLKIMGCMRYRAREGLAFRGHEVCEVNLYHHVKFTATGDPLLSSWLSRSHDYISPQCQNDYLTLFSNTIDPCQWFSFQL